MKYLIKGSDNKYLIASLFISTIYGFFEIFRSEISVNLHILLSNDSLYLYFLNDLKKNIISLFNNSTNQLVSPLSYFFINLFYKLSNNFGLFFLNIISNTFVVYLFYKFINKFHDKKANSFLLFLLLINIFCYFEIFYNNFFELSILPRKLFGLIIFFAILINYFEFLRNGKNLFYILILYFLLFTTNIFLFIFLIMFSLFFFKNFIKYENIVFIFLFILLFIVYYFLFIQKIDTSIFGVSYQPIKIIDTVISVITRKVFLFNLLIGTINFLFILYFYKKNFISKIYIALITTSIFTPLVVTTSGVNLQNSHFIYYSQLLLTIISISNLYRIVLDKLYMKFLNSFILLFILSNIIILSYNLFLITKKSDVRQISEYDTLYHQKPNIKIKDTFNEINLYQVLNFVENNQSQFQDKQYVTNFRFFNNYFKFLKNYDLLFDSRLSKENDNRLFNFKYLSDIQFKNKNFCREQLIYNFYSHYKYFISMHSKINLNNLNISKSNLRAYYDFNNVFRKFYYVNDKLLQNENLQVHSDNKIFIIFKDMICSNIKFNKIYFENKDFVIGSL